MSDGQHATDEYRRALYAAEGVYAFAVESDDPDPGRTVSEQGMLDLVASVEMFAWLQLKKQCDQDVRPKRIELFVAVGFGEETSSEVVAADNLVHQYEERLRAAVKDDEIVRQAAAVLKVGMDSGDEPLEAIRRCLASFCLDALGIPVEDES